MGEEDYYGRLFTKMTLPDEIKEKVKSLPSFIENNGQQVCQRCATVLDKETELPDGDYYCRNCLIFGRIRTSENLYYLPQKEFPKHNPLKWQGQLTSFQEEVSEKLLKSLENQKNILVHAVTGAGKTEMIYKTVARVVGQGGSVALVSPRIDVCNELYHRFSRDFSCPIVLLHGESDPYSRAPLVVSTVHQLYKFYQAFDLIIVDEVDAFPYVDNPQLYRAVKNALKPTGLNFYLTATSTDQLDKEVKTGRLEIAHLSRRFHGNPLVIPKPKWLGDLLEHIEKGKLPRQLINDIEKQRQTNYPLLIFFPHIAIGQDFVDILKGYFPKETIAFVSSQTENRLDIVEAFRDKKVTILISTTILERGVTFPCVDVFVLWSNHKLYNRSSLVQIGGRVGRSMDRPTGELVFYHDGVTRDMKRAISEIKMMNQKGGFYELSSMSK